MLAQWAREKRWAHSAPQLLIREIEGRAPILGSKQVFSQPKVHAEMVRHPEEFIERARELDGRSRNARGRVSFPPAAPTIR